MEGVKLCGYRSLLIRAFHRSIIKVRVCHWHLVGLYDESD